MHRPNNPATGALTRCGISLVLLTVAGLGAGCGENFDRRDTVSLAVGDAVEVNKATQTIERWPRAATQDRWRSDGERARIAAERYHDRTDGEKHNSEVTAQQAAESVTKK